MFLPTSQQIDLCKNLRVLVVGDVMLDHYLRGVIERTSPEAPVPVLRVETDDYILGGAANVAHNLAAMGARVEMAGVIGDDANAPLLLGLLESARIGCGAIVRDPSRPTTLKTRAVAQGQQVLRIDREIARPVGPAAEADLRRAVAAAIPRCNGVIVSDYGKGVLTPGVLAAVVEGARRAGIPVVADPKGLEYRRYKGIDVLTPNQKEAQAASGIEIADEASLARAAAALNRQVEGRAIAITRGAQGVSVFPRRGKPVHIPAQPREVFDVTGAGDTFIAHFALAMLSGLDLREAAAWANLAAGIVVGRLGVAVVTPEELLDHAHDERHAGKRRTAETLESVVRSLRAAGRKVVFTNGCFDLLHVGHIRFLEAARKLGDCLIVAINSDESVRAVKGPPRPLIPESERADVLASLGCVDHVVVFSDRSPEPLIRRLRPNVLVKGGNFAPDEVVGREIVKGYGGDVRVLPLFGERSVTGLIEKWVSERATAPTTPVPASAVSAAKPRRSARKTKSR